MLSIGSFNGTTAECQKLQMAMDLANEVLGESAFDQAVLNFVQSDEQTLGFTATTDARALVLSKIKASVAGAQIRLVFQIQTPPWYRRWFTKEVAHETPDGVTVMNRDAFHRESVAALANTIVHEYCHQLGYSHPYWASYERANSVPYGVGDIVESLAMKLPALVAGTALA